MRKKLLRDSWGKVMVPSSSQGSNDMTNTSTVWKSSTKGDIALSEMATPHLSNAINKVRNEIAEGDTSKQELLTNLETEYSTRTDVDSASA